jgi:hypothetical protein
MPAIVPVTAADVTGRSRLMLRYVLPGMSFAA